MAVWKFVLSPVGLTRCVTTSRELLLDPLSALTVPVLDMLRSFDWDGGRVRDMLGSRLMDVLLVCVFGFETVGVIFFSPA